MLQQRILSSLSTRFLPNARQNRYVKNPLSRYKHAKAHPARQTKPINGHTPRGAGTSGEGNTQGGKERVIFERTPSWYFRNWMWALVGMDVIWTANGVDITYNKWSRRVEAPTPDGPQYETRPLWQRVGASTFVTVGGICLAAGMLLMRRRVVRKMVMSGDGKTLSIQTAANREGKYFDAQKIDCLLKKGRDESEMVMKVKGVKGDYWLNLDGATITQHKGGLWDARRRFHEIWYGVQLQGRWSQGSHQGAWM